MNANAKRKVRLIGGSHSGETVESGEQRIKLFDMTNCDFGLRQGPDDTTVAVKYEFYNVHELRYESGHSHRYGVHESMMLVNGMNVMWDAYSTVDPHRYRALEDVLEAAKKLHEAITHDLRDCHEPYRELSQAIARVQRHD